MKLAISGKGGVGKTTLAAALARQFADDGQAVIAIDADLDSNLASALGVPVETAPRPIAQMTELIAERTESGPQGYGKFFKLNPAVSDIPDQYSVDARGVQLMVLGTAKRGGSGCACPENVFLRALLAHLVLRRDETLIVDMEAGIEHLGRATAQGMDALVVVVNESPWSLRTALRVRKLAGDIGLTNVMAVANRVTDSTDIAQIERDLEGVELIGQVPFDAELAAGVLQGDGAPRATAALERHTPAVEAIIAALDARA